jgi:hypothetical protein
MKKIFAIIIFCNLFAACPANAEYKKYTRSMNCAPLSEVLADIGSKEIQELPFWIGSAGDPEIKYSLVVNKKTDTWTIIQYNALAACIIALGENNQFFEFGEKRQ